uniref:Uncharacterized protein n=1 Tax=Lobelia melliana TaxID=1715894 RepID=A0A1Z2QZR1_9ASTR|nr:hypothetical protein Lo_mel1Pt0117 [Lobelia melliana]ASA36929.1 hypothetical protein Lo_mel1Pt0117 [Lobelia melliana]
MTILTDSDLRSKCPCYYCRTNCPTDCYNHSNYNSQKDYNSPDCKLKNEKDNGINGKRFPELEKESLFPQTDKTGRKFLSEKHEPALTCPHGKKYQGYKHSYNKGHCETCKIFLKPFQLGSEEGERWINEKIPRLSQNRRALEALQENIKSLLREAAQKPKTEPYAWNLGFWHGALLRVQRLNPED